MEDKKHRVCPVEHAGKLDKKFRRLIQNPYKMLKPYIKEGMTVMDLGCGPGFFTLDMAKLVGSSGQVVAVDLQEGMLSKLEDKILKHNFDNIIKLHKCQSDNIGLSLKADFILIFYLLHEVPDQNKFMLEVKSLLKDGGKVFIAEPTFHVSKDDFQKSLDIIKESGFKIIEKPKILLTRSILLEIAE